MNPVLERGDKVRTAYGDTETVMVVEQSRVITYESARRGNWWHPTKVWKVKGGTEAMRLPQRRRG